MTAHKTAAIYSFRLATAAAARLRAPNCGLGSVGRGGLCLLLMKDVVGLGWRVGMARDEERVRYTRARGCRGAVRGGRQSGVTRPNNGSPIAMGTYEHTVHSGLTRALSHQSRQVRGHHEPGGGPAGRPRGPHRALRHRRHAGRHGTAPCAVEAGALPPRYRHATATLPPRCRHAAAALPPRYRRATATASMTHGHGWVG
jgi:hypothetical protein